MNAVVAEPMVISTQDTSIEVPSFSLGEQPTVLGDIYPVSYTHLRAHET